MKPSIRHCVRCKRTLAETTILRIRKGSANATGLCGFCIMVHRRCGQKMRRDSKAVNLTPSKMALNLVERITREERARYAAN